MSSPTGPAPSAVPTCPLCGSDDTVPVVHGPPTPETMRAVQAGRVHWGGAEARPRHEGPGSIRTAHCRRCAYQWRPEWLA